jgi:hypothetical protein
MFGVLWNEPGAMKECPAPRSRVSLAENCIKLPLIKMIKRTTRRACIWTYCTLQLHKERETPTTHTRCDPAKRQDGSPFHTSSDINACNPISIWDWLGETEPTEPEKTTTESRRMAYRLFSAPQLLTYTSDLPVMLPPIERILTKYLPALPINTTTHHQRSSVPHSLFASSTSPLGVK